MSHAVVVRGLGKAFRSVRALDDVSFEVPSGSLFGLLGPNGAGKTTLFSIAAGFLKPTAGSIEVLGTDVRLLPRLQGRFALLPQDAALQRDIPVIDQLVTFGRLAGMGPRRALAAALRALEFVGLASVASRTAGALSHGMAKRVAVAQTILASPEVILLDEPTSGLDPENARALRDLIRHMKTEGRTVLLSSHNLQEVQDLCDEVAILHLGRLVERGSMADLTGSRTLLRIGLARELPEPVAQALLALPAVAALERTGPTDLNLRLAPDVGDGIDDALGSIYTTLGDHGLWPHRVTPGASLETRFLEITGGVYDGASST